MSSNERLLKIDPYLPHFRKHALQGGLLASEVVLMGHSGYNAVTYFRNRHIHGLKLRLQRAEEGSQPTRAASRGPLAVE